MAEELDQNQKIASVRRKKDMILMKVDMLEATHKVTLEAREMEIGFLRQKLDELDGTVKFYSGVFGAMERESIDLKRKLEEQEQWKRENALLYTVKNELAKIQIKELQAKVFELENKLKIQDNEISQNLIDENKEVSG